MKILYDHQCFAMQNYGGISRYHYHLIKEFEKQTDIDVKLSLAYSNNFYINNDNKLRVKKFFPNNKFYFKRTILDLINRKYTIPQIKEGNYDIFHPTYYNPYFLKHLKDKPFVITVHDIIHELHPEIRNKIDRTIENKKSLLNVAKLIIANSNNTKKDLMNIYGISYEKIEVVYLAASVNKQMSLKKDKLLLPEKYILYVGNRDFYKNFINFVLAVESLLKEYSDIYLVTAGGGNFSKEELEFFESKKLQSKILLKKADDASLATLYTNALAFVFPTLYEGFGIPALEAMNCDCPVIMSNTSSLPEVGGDAAIYFDPTDIGDIKAKIEMVIFNPELRKELIRKVSIQRENFSYEKTAKQMKRIYSQLIK
ncbi:MAG: glycosyltransferase family 1 protein [Ignavibacteriaceae bacterium]